MKRLSLILTFLMSLATSLTAQNNRVSGNVTGPNGPVANAIVKEMDGSHRIINQTRTDGAGNYTMSVFDPSNSLQVSASGCKTSTQKMKSRTLINIALVERPLSKLSQLDSFKGKKHKVESDKLLCGHMGIHNVAMPITIEQITDTLVTVTIPLRVSTLIENYPEGRNVVFLDYTDNHIIQGYSVDEAMPQVGEPFNRDDDVHFRGNISNAQLGNENKSSIYVYPQFLFSIQEMFTLLNHEGEFARVAVDNTNATNYWLLYPTESFGEELEKILNKMSK